MRFRRRGDGRTWSRRPQPLAKATGLQIKLPDVALLLHAARLGVDECREQVAPAALKVIHLAAAKVIHPDRECSRG